MEFVAKTPCFLTLPELSFGNGLRKSLILRRPKWIRTAIVTTELRFWSVELGQEIVVPAGFVSDGASVPQALWNLFPPFGRYLEAAIIHDYLCKIGKEGLPICNSREAHKVFLEAMKAQNILPLKRRLMWAAVRLLGPRFTGPTKS